MVRLLCFIFLVFGCPLAGGVIADTPRSIISVPSDAAFFFGLHNQSDLVRRIAGSPTVKKIREIMGEDVAIQDALGMVIEYTPDEDAIPGSDDAMSVLRQLLVSDAFVWGDANWAQTFQAVNQITQRTEVTRKKQGEAFDALQLFMSIPEKELSKVRLPSTVLAFQLDDIEPATRLLDRAHAWLSANPPPEWALYRGRKPVGVDHMLVFTLRPWEYDGISVDWDDTKADPQAVTSRFQQILDDRELVVAIGIVQSRLTGCFAEDLSAVRRMVDVESDNQMNSIANQPDFKSLLSEQQGSLITSAYVSDDLVAARNQLETPGFLASVSSLLETIPTMLSDPNAIDGGQMAMISTFAKHASERFASISDRWNALATKPAGWSFAIWANKDGIAGRSFVRSMDEKLGEHPLDAHLFTGEHVLFFYAWQSTTLADRLLLVFESAESVIDTFTGGALLAMELDEAPNEIPDEDAEKLRQARAYLASSTDELNKIVREYWVPSLHEGGHAIVISTVDPFPENDEASPVAISVLTRLSDKRRLRTAGSLLLEWANESISQYGTFIDEPLDGTLPLTPTATSDGGSDLFRFPITASPVVEKVSAAKESDAETEIAWKDDDASQESLEVHWRVSDQLLVASSDENASKAMLQRRKADWPNRDGTLRSVAELSFREISAFYTKATQMVPNEDRQTMLQIADVLEALNRFRSETRTVDGQTRTFWRLAMPLGP